jgi:CDP-diacylglycerol--glycerol-3-phosphate 3-phosphatidyltransferase
MKLPTIYDLKPAFQNLLRPVCRRLAGWGISANQVTLFAALLSILQGAWIAMQPENPVALSCLPMVLFVRMALNAIDGMLAREFSQKTRLGGILNELGDVVSDTALYLPFALHPAFSPWLVVLFVILAVLTEFAGVLAVAIGSQRRYDGPMGKSDRALLWGAIGFLGAVGLPLAGWVDYLLVLGILLLSLTVLKRVRGGLRG